MSRFNITDDNKKAQLIRFLNRRQLNEPFIELLASAKEKNGLNNRQLNSAVNLSYAKILENLEEALKNKWIREDEILAMLERSELSGKQHVYVFTIPEDGGQQILSELANATNIRNSQVDLDDFLEIPQESSVRILRQTNSEVLLKIVKRRRYWIAQTLEDTVSRQLIERNIHEERTAIIVKANATSGMLQIRVPSQEKGVEGTAKSMYRFLYESLSVHYPMQPTDWFHSIVPFRLSDAFSKIIDNRNHFRLRKDSPETATTKTTISMHSVSRNDPSDLRDDESWMHGQGYSRTHLKGFWKIDENGEESEIFVHMNCDSLRTSTDASRVFTRLVFPSIVSDRAIDAVIHRLSENL